ncbi:hypothetical protein EVAR_56103_1 [Eumeta japonica]|uniref:Uncharacterized protein n=1 Tax=Eumeta variegata TaxID=151549 RepID=A0A4C1YHX4_EUMVA|nr:hypothetical protein EVAR_56103_1 [Eumeta japonica]
MNKREVHEDIKKEVDIRTISWKFIPLSAPNMGGAWHLVNSKPLTEMDIEPTVAEGFTPNHYLIGRSCGAAAADHFDDNVLLAPENWRTC